MNAIIKPSCDPTDEQLYAHCRCFATDKANTLTFASLLTAEGNLLVPIETTLF